MAATATGIGVPLGTWRIDPSHSLIEFSVSYLGIGCVKGRFASFRGSLRGDEGGIRLEGEIDVASATTHEQERDAHLASPDFFDVARHPKARFHSTRLSLADDGELRVAGVLRLKGVEREVELEGSLRGPAGDPWGNERVALELSGGIDRNDFGIGWNAPLPGGGVLLGDRVGLELVFSAVKAR
jgi:polyisoprenoid-binding protein YceI